VGSLQNIKCKESADAGNVVLMSGTQLHVPQICSGIGKRNCIVVHVVIE
jgi:hypothetical protein